MTQPILPLTPEWQQQLDQFSATQLAWLSGYCWAKSQNSGAAVAALPETAAAVVETSAAVARKITVLSASQTGNARRVAEQLLVQLQEAQLDAQIVAAGDYKAKNIASEDIVLLVASTQGEGEPAEEAVSLHKFLHGKKAPNLAGVSFAVLGLGDSSYPNFCQAGKDFDAALEKLGATRLAARVDCDLDFQATADAWRNDIAKLVTELAQASAVTSSSAATPPSFAKVETAEQHFTKEQPFSATLSVSQKITASGANKDVRHIEIDLGDSGIHYTAGDALGVWFSNDEQLVNEVLSLSGLSGDEPVTLANGQSVSIRVALTEHDELTQNTPQFVKGYAQISQNADLLAVVDDAAKLQALIDCTPIVGVLNDYPHALSAEQLHGLLRPLTPRMYSIASAQAEVDAEVHLTVGRVAYEHHGNAYTGGASGFLADRLEEGTEVKVFIEPNRNFRLPENGDTPVIMIGAGTGVAPFRAFMQQRDNNGDAGKNWLVFGNQKFTDDFLYQAEWLQYRKSGLLSNVSTAWSRQGKEKVYVQHKLREHAQEVWQWLQEGAHVYVCGDALKMAKDVEKALLDIIAEHGNMSLDDADEYLSELRENKRYQRDVY